MTRAPEAVQHGPYRLCMDVLAGGLLIRRRGDDGRTRLVATIETLPQWDRFVAALEAGADEVAAVHAIDAE